MNRDAVLLVRCSVVTVFAAAIVAVIVYLMRPEYESLRKGRADEGYLTSQDCRRCHEDRFASWSRTNHSRMTQEARPGTVQGDFAHDNSFDYMGDQGHDGETRITVWALRIGVIVMPLAFLMAGIWHYSNDPGLAIWLVPPAALLVIFGIAGMALATRTR